MAKSPRSAIRKRRVESELDTTSRIARQVPEASDQEPGADDPDARKSDLGDNEHSLHRPRLRAIGRAAVALAERGVQVTGGQTERREKSKDDSRCQRAAAKSNTERSIFSGAPESISAGMNARNGTSPR
jgi:hypothetical protein